MLIGRATSEDLQNLRTEILESLAQEKGKPSKNDL
jgi:hypothetical protein